MKAVDPSSGAGDRTTDRAVRRRAYHDGYDRWEIVEADPVPGLTGAVYLYGWWSEKTSSFGTRRELASTTGVFIVNLGSDLEIVDAAGTLHRLNAGQGLHRRHGACDLAVAIDRRHGGRSRSCATTYAGTHRGRSIR